MPSKPLPSGQAGEPEKPTYRIWATHCPFRKNGSPVLGTMGSTVDGVIVMRVTTWKRLVADVPQLQTMMFEVGTFDD